MKRSLFLIGMVSMLAPGMSYAADSAVCDAMKGVAPVSSHYVQKVLERADAALESAKSAGNNPGLENYFFSWAGRIGAAANGLIDAYLTLAVEQKDLLNDTACLHVDVLLIDCKINEAQNELQAQLGKKSIVGITHLESLLRFLQERKAHLVRGALNPQYEDPTWKQRWRFDSDDTVPPEDAEPLCPFDSDYAPPASDRYGCDVSVLGRISGYAPARDELNALTTLEAEIKKYKDVSSEFESLEKELAELYEVPPNTPAGTGTAETEAKEEKDKGHQEANGCMKKDAPLPEDLRLRSVRTPFSYKKNELYILSEFLGKRAAQGMFRRQEGDLRTIDEIEDEKEKETYERKENPLRQLYRNSARAFFQALSGNQGREESKGFAASPDSTLEIADALGDLRASVGELARLTGKDGEKDGLRGFVIRFAYFLRRSCIYRPCNASLERIMRTAYADECFPYTDGKFVTQDKDESTDPQWKKCAMEACIEIDEEGEENDVKLPESCKDVLPETP